MILGHSYEEKINNASFVNVSADAVLQRLNERLRYAVERSSYYRETLSASLPLRCLEDIEKLPFTDAETVRSRGREMICVGAGEIQRIVSLRSSGSTGEPKRLYFTQGDLQRTVDFFAEGMGWMCDKGDAVAILLPCASPDGVGDLLARGLEKLGCRPLRLGLVSRGDSHMETLMAERPAVLVGMPWQIRLLCLALPDLRPRCVLLSADYVPEAVYSFLAERWGCRVLNHFGMTETGYGCAVESLLHRGMYLRQDEIYAEIVDAQSGRVLPAGEMGELVLTTLRREAMPLIRYRTGDYARLSAEYPGCIEGVYGRIKGGADCSLQEALCPCEGLLDYALRREGAEAELLLRLNGDAAEEPIACKAAATLGISWEKLRLGTERMSPLDAEMFTLGKRME